MSNFSKHYPLAYLITFSCYGSRLHGDKKGSIDRNNNIFQTPILSFKLNRFKYMQHKMQMNANLLTVKQRSIVLKTIIDVCDYRNWILFAAHVRTNHIHSVIHAKINPEKIMADLKAYASRALSKNLTTKSRYWTRHGSTKYLWQDLQVEAAINYVLYEQGQPMAIFEHKTRDCRENPL